MISFKVAAASIAITFADVISIYDADTFRINLPNCEFPVACESVPIRAAGFDSPEIRGVCIEERIDAQLAKHITEDFLRNGKSIEIRNLRRGKYYRLLGDVYVDGYPLKLLHIKMGTGREYYGGARKSWCNEDR